MTEQEYTITQRAERKPVPTREIPVFQAESLRKEFEKPTISSLLDLDLYKLTMGQFAWRHYPDVPVKYEFKNRTKSVKIAKSIPQDVLENHLKRIQKLKLSDEEAIQLREENIFEEGYIQFLKNVEMPDFNVREEDGQYKIETEGPWSSAMYWETLILSTVNELYYRSLRHQKGMDEDEVRAEGEKRLQKKIKKLQKYIASEKEQGRTGPLFMDFGTRRRYSGEWQEHVVTTMKDAFPENLIGTSNIALGKKLNIPVIGTFAHEMDMVFSGIYHDMDTTSGTFASHNKMLAMWYKEYGKSLSIALTDTYGSDFFFDNFTREQAKQWNGLRQDSGDPIAFGERAINFYKQQGIDPKEKKVVFSDGLDVDAIIDIYEHFKGEITMVFGWGTTLTNDVGFDTLSLVMKATESNGHGTAKLSDNLAKATGKDEDVARAKHFAGYTRSEYKECKV